MQRRWLAAALGVAISGFWACAAHAVVVFPAMDYSARRMNNVTSGSSGGPSLDYRRDTGVDNRVGMEFSFAGLPTNQILAGATLRMMPTAKTGDSVLDIHGYVGNGLFAATDAYGDSNLMSIMTGHVVGTQKSVELDPGYISSLLGTASHLGLSMREGTNGALGSFASRATTTRPELDLLFLDPTAPNSNHWTATGDGAWNVTANWSLGIPIPSDDLFIQPASASTVFGPPTFDDVSTLTLGGGAGQATFVVPQDQQFMSHGLTTLYGNGVLDLNGGTYRTGGLNIRPGGTIDWGDDGALSIESGFLSTPIGEFVVDGPATPLLIMLGGKFYRQRTVPSGQSDNVIIGDTQGGYMLVASDSEVRVARMRIGHQETGNGTLQVEDEGTLVRISGLMEVGASGTGHVSVEQGGRLEGGLVFVGSTLQGAANYNTPDSMIFTDAGTTASLSGLESNGRSLVEIRNGAVVQAGGAGGSGDPANPPVLRVTGAGSRLILSDRLQTGSTFTMNGSSKVFVEDGGRIDTSLVVLGIASAMTGTSNVELTVTGSGSELNASSRVILGGLRTTQATANILDGGVFRAGDQTLLTAAVNDIANVLISGGGRWEQTGEISVGGGRDLNGDLGDIGTATLTLQNDGVLEATTAVNVMARGTLNLDGGILKAPLVRHDRGGTFNFTDGTLSTATFQGNLTNQGGILAPGASAGETSIEGNYIQQADGHLQIEIGGPTAGTDFDRVNITGTATLAGALGVSLIGDFTPGDGDTFEVLHADGGVFDMFTSTSLPPLSDGLNWNVIYSNFAVLLQVAAANLPGDFSQDGAVDAADYVVWRKSGGTQESYNEWRSHFGQTAGSSSLVNSAIPEPDMLGILASGLFAMVVFRPLAAIARSSAS